MRPGLAPQRRGLELSGMLAVVMTLRPTDFYKSMTTHADHTVWQDMYRPSTHAGDVYLKLTVIDDVLIVSFNLETAVGRARVGCHGVRWQGATTTRAHCALGGATRPACARAAQSGV